jgi:peptidoglycan/xylan/chitin deacetylase (PgdA/CDA1 family)
MIRYLKPVALTALILLLCAASLWQISRARAFQLFGEIIARVETREPVIALTFDDGPSPKYLGGVLQTLADHDVPATFFLVGSSIVEHPEAARTIASAGHEIGNHSFHHPRMVLMSQSRIADEITRTDTAIRDIGYDGPIQFRPPFGKKLIALPRYLAREGRATIMWDVEADDTVSRAMDGAGIAQTAIDDTRAGSIILLHVMYKSGAASRAALGPMIEGLKAKGFRFVRLTELLEMQP